MSAPFTVPFARNIAHNPKPASLTYFSGTGSTRTFVAERSYVGDGSARFVIPVGSNAVWQVGTDDDADISALSGAGTIHAVVHVSGPRVSSGSRVRIRLVYSDASFVDGTTIALSAVTGTDFVRITLPSVALNAAKTLRNIQAFFDNPSGSEETIYVGGLDVRKDQPIDAYVDGDSGPSYAWEGTADDSPSQRLSFTPVIGKGGVIFPSVRLEVVDRQGFFKRDITDHFIDGSITYDLDAEQWKGSISLTLDDPFLITALADEYVKVYLRVDHPDGTVDEGPIGMFMVDVPQERWISGGHDRWLYSGKDMLGLLATFMMRGVPAFTEFGAEEETVLTDSYVSLAGTTYAASIKEILSDIVGFSPGQYTFPSSHTNRRLDNGVAWESGTSVLTILTDLLMGCGLQRPWVTPHGIITSAPAGVNPASVVPSAIFATGDDSKVRWPFEVDPDASKVGNRVRVISAQNYTAEHPWSYTVEGEPRKKKKKKKKRKRAGEPQVVSGIDYVPRRRAIEAWAINNDPSHPLSFSRLGRWIDLPDVTIPVLSGHTEAQNLANQALIDAGNLPIRARLVTEVHVRGLNEVYELNLRDALGNPIASGQGRYWCRGWTLQLGSPWEMSHTLTRVIPFASRSFA